MKLKNEIIEDLSEKLKLKVSQIENVLNMLMEGATIPFIARYRKEVTGNLNEDELRNIENVYKYNVNLSERKDAIKRLIDEKGMLTHELIKEIDLCTKLSEVEDIYLPFKEKRKTKGTEAIKLGLEPLANLIMEFSNKSVEELASSFLNDKVKTIEDAMVNAGYIIADKISDNIKYRKWIKNYCYNNGIVKTNKKKNSVDERKVYEIYYEFEAKISNIKSHQIFAINRAENEKIITYSLKFDDLVIINYLNEQIIGNKEFKTKEWVLKFIEDAYKRLINPSIERDIKSDLFDKASETGIKEFGNNLENVLLTPPIKEAIVMGFDPAFRTGCKLAIVSKTGDVLEIDVIYPHEPKKMVEEANKIMLNLINKHDVKIIAIGNGTASRESEQFVANLIKENNLNVQYILVSEAGASVYSASPLAKEEFPDYSVEQRSAVSIARRLQDALSELVKIDPKSIGVGLYQHDLKSKELDNELEFRTSKIVNQVGVNLNNASANILNYVSGLNKKTIKSILDYRKKNGSFKSREDLLKIKGLDNKIYEQCAGFLRIVNGINPLDKTNIHPEDYELVTKILTDYGISLNKIGSEEIKLSLININENEVINRYNISKDKFNMLKNNLINGVIDPREELPKVNLKSDILTIDDLQEGDTIEGIVRNVTSFGAFVDIGLHNDALIHISKLSKSFVNHPSEILKVGDILAFFVSDIDKEKERVGLSLIK